jgi:diguanylate cyclase
MGGALSEVSRGADVAARYGGEEFCLLLPGSAKVQVAELLGRLRTLLADAGPDGSTVTFSAGVAMWDGTEEADVLIRRADGALYAAKESGRDRACTVGSGDGEPVAFDLARTGP